MRKKGKYNYYFFLADCGCFCCLLRWSSDNSQWFCLLIKKSWILVLSFWTCWAWFGTRNCCPQAVCKVSLNVVYPQSRLNLFYKGWATFQFLKQFLDVVDVTGLQSSFLKDSDNSISFRESEEKPGLGLFYKVLHILDIGQCRLLLSPRNEIENDTDMLCGGCAVSPAPCWGGCVCFSRHRVCVTLRGKAEWATACIVRLIFSAQNYFC